MLLLLATKIYLVLNVSLLYSEEEDVPEEKVEVD